MIDFDCAARWGKVKLAAQELHKTATAVSEQVKRLEETVEAILRISTTQSFAIKWLVPRHRFTELYPELDIRIDSNDAPWT